MAALSGRYDFNEYAASVKIYAVKYTATATSEQ
jgi:hypothetical protein